MNMVKSRMAHSGVHLHEFSNEFTFDDNLNTDGDLDNQQVHAEQLRHKVQMPDLR